LEVLLVFFTAEATQSKSKSQSNMNEEHIKGNGWVAVTGVLGNAAC